MENHFVFTEGDQGKSDISGLKTSSGVLGRMLKDSQNTFSELNEYGQFWYDAIAPVDSSRSSDADLVANGPNLF